MLASLASHGTQMQGQIYLNAYFCHKPSMDYMYITINFKDLCRMHFKAQMQVECKYKCNMSKHYKAVFKLHYNSNYDVIQLAL